MRKLTLVEANIITIKRWDVAITTKYTSASLLTVLMMFDTLIPWYLGFMSCICTMMMTKTMVSVGTVRRVNLEVGVMKCLPKRRARLI